MRTVDSIHASERDTVRPAIVAVRPAREPMRYHSEKTVRVTVDVNVSKMTLAGVLLAIVIWQIMPAIVDAVVTIAGVR